MNRIREVLAQKGIKIKWLSEQLGKSYPTMITYTTNKRQPSLEDLYRIAKILNVNVKDLLVDNIEAKKNEKR